LLEARALVKPLKAATKGTSSGARTLTFCEPSPLARLRKHHRETDIRYACWSSVELVYRRTPELNGLDC
jgi:hypothetical protein